MYHFIKGISAPVLITLLISCGGGGAEQGSTGDPDTPPPTSSTPDIANGQREFEQQCSDCHTITAPIMIKSYNVAGLARAIETGMPLNDASQCGAVCSRDIAAYLAQFNDSLNSGGSSSSSSSGAIQGLGEINIPTGAIDPAPIVAQRLTRVEYNNTVQDLFYTDLSPADEFPEDDFAFGFNNVGSVLSVSLAHTEQYKKAVEQLVDEAILKALGPLSETFDADALTINDQASLTNDGSVMFCCNAAEASVTVSAPQNGIYKITIQAGQQAGGPDDANMAVHLNGNLASNITVSAPRDAMVNYEVQLNLAKGSNTISVNLTNDYWVQDVADLNLYVGQISVEDTASAIQGDTIFSCDISEGLACAQTTAAEFGARAWRRPLSQAEVTTLVGVYQTVMGLADSQTESMAAMLSTIMLSPHFLYRIERDANLASETAQPLDGYELASRLSYFVWASMPDETLFDLASSGDLLNEQNLKQQVRRMLDSSKANNLIETFAAQWLQFDDVANATPDSTLFPDFDEQLVESLRQETRLFLNDWLRNNGSLTDLVSANHTFLDERAAQHYGVSVNSGASFERYTWGGQARHGILGHASILTATSHSNGTSPVQRGKWVLDKLLCKEPPPPPPGVENLSEEDDLTGLSTRGRFELHRDKSTVCYSCHVLMDPIGFGLENFSAIGQWRTTESTVDEGSVNIDATGSLPGGQSFQGPEGLSDIIGNTPELALCTAKQLSIFALGRGVHALEASEQEGSDDPLVYDLYLQTRDNGHRIQDMIEALVLSQAFRARRGADSVGGVE